MRERLDAASSAVRHALGNRDLRLVQLASSGQLLGNWTYGVGMTVFAYEAGGAGAIAIAALVRAVPSALATPFAAALGDRYAPVRVMVGSDLVRAVITAAMVVAVLSDAPAGAVYGLGALLAAVTRAYGPAQAALLPSLARSPDELTAANAVSMTLQNVAMFIGPAVGGLLIVAGGPSVVFAVNGAGYLWSALLVGALGRRGAQVAPPQGGPREGMLPAAFAGFVAIAREPGLRLLMFVAGIQIVVYGALTVLAAVLAFRLLDTGAAGLGVLQSALGIGGLVGSVVSLGLAGSRRLGSLFGVGTALWGAIALAAASTSTVLAVIVFALVGIASSVADVALITLLQRGVPGRLLARVFGVVELLGLVGVPIGAALAAPLITWLGVRPAIVATGAVLPVLVALGWRQLLALDVQRPRERELALLRSNPIFAPLPETALARVAELLVPVDVPARTIVVREGEPGDRFYLVAEGEALVTVDGRAIATLAAGESFGEIALLRDVPRTATVTARSDLRLLALDSDEFLASVTRYPETAEAADAVVAARLSLLGAAS